MVAVCPLASHDYGIRFGSQGASSRAESTCAPKRSKKSKYIGNIFFHGDGQTFCLHRGGLCLARGRNCDHPSNEGEEYDGQVDGGAHSEDRRYSESVVGSFGLFLTQRKGERKSFDI